MGLREDLGEGRVRHLAVDADDVAACRADRCEGLAVRLARRHLVADLVARELERLFGEAVRLARLRQPRLEVEIAHATELGDGRVRVVERLAVPALLVLHGCDALSLQGGGEDRGRPVVSRGCFRVGAVDLLDVVTVDLDRMPSERARAAREHIGAAPGHRLAPLAEPVHVDDRRQVGEPVVRSVLERLPHRPFGHL